MKKTIFFRKPLGTLFYLLSFCCILSFSVTAQNFQELDSLLVDRDIDNYSIRVFTNFKVNKFSIKNNGYKARYVPNNRHGIGLGFANEKIIIDIGFNLKNPNKEETKRFDLQGTTIFKNRNFVNVYGQTYRGFSAKNNFDEPTLFRSDIRSVSIGFNYLYAFDDIEFSYALLKAGLSEKQHNTIFLTGGIGGFTSYDYFSADKNILTEDTSPYFNEEAKIKRYNGFAVGVLAGLITYIKLPENITATVNLMPGIGIMHKKITLQNDSYIPSNPLLYKLDFLIGLGYRFKQFYASLTYSNGLYSTDFDHGNKYNLKLTKAKLAIGYRFKSRKKD